MERFKTARSQFLNTTAIEKGLCDAYVTQGKLLASDCAGEGTGKVSGAAVTVARAPLYNYTEAHTIAEEKTDIVPIIIGIGAGAAVVFTAIVWYTFCRKVKNTYYDDDTDDLDEKYYLSPRKNYI